MKTTDKQIVANRANAAKSTGPITPSGKAVAARNAIKHGLLAKEIVIQAGEGDERNEQFDVLLADLTDQFDPYGPLEEMLVEKIAAAYWRLRRAHSFEVGLIRDKLDRVVERYYAARHSGNQKPKRRTDAQIDADIRKAEEVIEQWQARKADFAKLREKEKGLSVICDRRQTWDVLYDNREAKGFRFCDRSPQGMYQSLKDAGLTIDQIWQLHLGVCDDAITEQQEKIRSANAEKKTNKHTLQVMKNLASIPEGHDLDRLLKYEGSIERQFYKAVDQLERLQRLRRGDTVPAPVKVDVLVDAENAQS